MFLFNWQLKLIATSPFFISSRSSFILQIQNYAKNFHTPSSAFFSNLSIQVCHYCLLFSEFLRRFRPSSLLFHSFLPFHWLSFQFPWGCGLISLVFGSDWASFRLVTIVLFAILPVFLHSALSDTESHLPLWPRANICHCLPFPAFFSGEPLRNKECINDAW